MLLVSIFIFNVSTKNVPTDLIVLVCTHLFPGESGQIETLPEVVPGTRVVVTLVGREQARVDTDLEVR